MKTKITTFLLILFAGNAWAFDCTKLYPSDEASQDASFLSFRGELKKAIRQRDRKFILNILDPNITNSFGGDGGIEEFKKIWKPEKPDSLLWKTLHDVLKAGGSFNTHQEKEIHFVAPYIFSNFPKEFDVFKYAAVTGPGVRVREHPSLKSPVVGTLSYDIIYINNWRPQQIEKGSTLSWLEITTCNNKKGYIEKSHVRSAIDYRAIFKKKNNRWLLNALVAGD